MNKKDFLFAIFYVVLLKQLYNWLVSKGLGVHFNKHHPGQCHVIPGLQCGSEKISVMSNGLAFITSNNQLYTNCNKDLLKGKLYLFDFNQPEKGVLELNIKGLFNTDQFDPHGMDILEDLVQGMAHIYVVNHANRTESVEVFRFHMNKREEVTYVKTIKDDNFVCLNDLVVISQNEFYVTNFAKYCHSSFKFLIGFEILFGLNTANILYYRQGRSTVVQYGSVLNGIAADDKHVFAVSTAAGAVIVYERLAKGQLKRIKMIQVGYSPDNIYYERTSGDLFVGYQKTIFKHFALAENRTDYSSASAVKISRTGDNWRRAKVTEILHDSGKNFIHGVSSAVHYKDSYLFGTVFHKLAYCTKNKPAAMSSQAS